MTGSTNWRGLSLVIASLGAFLTGGGAYIQARALARDQAQANARQGATVEGAYDATAKAITDLRVEVAGLKAEVSMLRSLVLRTGRRADLGAADYKAEAPAAPAPMPKFDELGLAP